MSNLRWILLFAGFAILLLLYFSGRPRKQKSDRTDRNAASSPEQLDPPAGNGFDPDALAQDLQPGDPAARGSFQVDPQAGTPMDAYAGVTDYPPAHTDPSAYQGGSMSAPGMHPQGVQPGRDVLMEPADYYTAGHPDAGLSPADAGEHAPHYGDPDQFSPSDVFSSVDPDDFQRPASAPPPARPEIRPDIRSDKREKRQESRPDVRRDTPSAASDTDSTPGVGASIGEKIEAIGAKLSPRRKSRVAASVPADAQQRSGEDSETKIVSLHVVAPEGQLISGQLLFDTFQSRGYHHGDMAIFHSLHNGNTVFSLAKMVVPGTFDINDPESFATPGITLFLQLPGPVPGDVAFEVLISEAHELSSALGCNILDSDRSTLTRQTVQHLRESVYQFMHRQKYFNKTPAKAPG